MTTLRKASCITRPGLGYAHRGFTLFEVSISLVLVAFGVVSVLMLFPSGLKAQQMARFQIYAAAKAEEMIEQFNGTQHSNPAIDSEGLALWDVPAAHKAQSWDLESRISAHRFGIMPIPLDVARRLDSDADEIQHILDEGGYVYYSQPLASTGTQEQGAPTAPPNEAQKLIIGVRGYAQQNGLSSFPLKNWPYHTPFPSPPLQMHHLPDKWLPLRVSLTDISPMSYIAPTNYYDSYYSYYAWPWKDNEDQKYWYRENIRNNSETYCVPWETSPGIPPLFPGDPDIQKVYDWPVDRDNPGGATVIVKPNYPQDAEPQVQPLHVGYFPYACGRLWEAGGYNLPDWREWEDPVNPPAQPPVPGADDTVRRRYTPGTLVLRGGVNYTSLIDHRGCLTNDNMRVPPLIKNDPPNATYWRVIDGNFPATHLEQVTSSVEGEPGPTPPRRLGTSGKAVYGEYPSRPSVCRYVATTLWYAQAKGVSTSGTDPYEGFTLPERDRWKEVQAFRFLAHATTCLTAWYSYGNETENLRDGVSIPVVKLANVPSPAGEKITHTKVKYFHERSLHLINLFASSYPNDWAMPRPLNRVTMMDYPLMQFDLFTPPTPSGLPSNPHYNSTDRSRMVTINNQSYTHLFGRSQTDNPQQWRVVSPEPIRNIGVSATYPINVINPTMRRGGYDPASHFGDISHFSLTAPFEAAERCRELVFWVADWQSYEDFETAPSAPVDASKYPIAAPRGDWHGNAHVVPTWITRSWDNRMDDMEFRDEQLWSYRNPEKTLAFFKVADPDNAYERGPDLPNRIAGNINVDPLTIPTGFNVECNMILNRPWNSYPDRGWREENRKNFVGLYGADRNFNKILDRGPLPKSVRIRATTVARFCYYDPRVQAILR